MAASLIYDHLAAGRLRWVGVAHRGAGAFDDIVLGLDDATVGVQVKTSATPTPFRLEARLLGAEAVWQAAIDGLRKLAALDPPHPAAVIYECDDPASLNDQLGDVAGSSSAELLDLHRRHAATWTLQDWDTTPFSAFLRRLQHAAGLEDGAFLDAWRAISFVTDGEGRLPGAAERTAQDTGRIEALAALLPKLAADRAGRDRWEVDEILARLGWRDVGKPRHSHRFPIHALHHPNERGLKCIADALEQTRKGYLALVGPPGCGKSTLLAEGVLGAEAVRTVRYLAFVPNGRTLGRGEACDFLHDVIADLKLQGLGSTIVVGQSLPELRQQFGALLGEAGRRFATTGVRTLIIIDGLDHIPREQTVERSLLAELPPPDAIPDGVLFLLGTQRLDLADIPFAVQHQAGNEARCISVPPLSREAVLRLAVLAGIPSDIDPHLIFERTHGHPLSTRYVLEGLASQPDEAARSAWFAAAPAYAGDIDTFYASAWHALQAQPEARKTLTFLALADGGVRDSALEALTNPETVEQAWQAANHLLRLDDDRSLSLFHNSFRLFLQARASERFGRPDPSGVRRRYLDLAGMARAADPDDPQRWMELRYQARAGAEDDVLRLATPEHFRDQFIEGRSRSEIQDDLGLAFRAVAARRRADRILPLLLSRHEIDLRAQAVSADIIDAHLSLGDRDAARGLLDIDGAVLGVDISYRVIDADLAAGDIDRARGGFEDVEPLEQLLGAKPVSDLSDEGSLVEWARRVLAFRTATQFLSMIGRLTGSEGVFRAVDIEALRTRLRFEAMDGELARRPATDPDGLRKSLGLLEDAVGVALLYGALASHAAKRPAEAVGRVEAAVGRTLDLDDHERRTLAWLAARLDRLDLAERAIDGVPPPNLESSNFRGDDDFAEQVDEVLNYAELTAWMGRPQARGSSPSAAFLSTLQTRLEDLGGLFGLIAASAAPAGAPDALTAALRDLARAEGDGPHDFDRHRLDRIMGGIVARITGAAIRLDPTALGSVFATLDDAPDTDWRLRQSEVRRAFGLRMFRHDHDLESARERVTYVPGGERTPEAQLAEASHAAIALSRLGLETEARALLRTMHLEGCGLSRPAKKDPQYIAWAEMLEQACSEDPAGREARVAFLTRFISGLAGTEGHDSGGRVLPEVLVQAAQGRTALTMAAADRAQSLGEMNWPGLIASLGRGVASRNPDLTLSVATVVGRLAAPFVAEYDGDPFEGLIAGASAGDVERVTERILDVIETDTAEEVRLKLLEAAGQAARDRGVEAGCDRLHRWQGELPRPRSGSSPEDPFFHARTLTEIDGLISTPGDHPWNATRAFARIAPREGYPAARTFLERHPTLSSDKRVLKVMGDLALGAGDAAAAEGYRDALWVLARDRSYFDQGWSGGAKLLAWTLDVGLRGEAAREEAFDAFLSDLANGWVWPAHLLQYIVDVLRLLSPAPTWSEAWASFESHLRVFREFELGAPLDVPPPADGDGDGIDLVADLLWRAMHLGPSALAEQVRLSLLELEGTPEGVAVIVGLMERLLDGVDDEVLRGAQIAWVFRETPAVETALAPQLTALAAHPDYGVRRIGRALGLLYGVSQPPSLDPSGTTAAPVGPAPASLKATWPIARALKMTAEASGKPLDGLNRRAAAIIAAFERPPTRDEEKAAAWRATSLDVFSPQPKVAALAAFRAQRILLTELMIAGELPPPDAEEIVQHCGVDAVVDHDLRLEPRPAGLCRPRFGEPYRDEDFETWLSDVAGDVVGPVLDTLTLVAGWSRHRSFTRSADLTAEQVHGLIPGREDVDRSVHALAPLLAQTRLILGKRVDETPVVRRLIGGPFWNNAPAIGFCPAFAAGLGWRPCPRDPTHFRDERGLTQVRTLTWRDSGCVGRLHGETVLREGQLIVASPAAAERLARGVDLGPRTHAWRTVSRGDGPKRQASASTDLAMIEANLGRRPPGRR